MLQVKLKCALLRLLQGAGNLVLTCEAHGATDSKASAANAQNLINQFDTANSQNVAGQNTNTQNAAQQYNLANSQNIANQNVGLANQQQLQNNAYQQQNYQDQAQKLKCDCRSTELLSLTPTKVMLQTQRERSVESDKVWGMRFTVLSNLDLIITVMEQALRLVLQLARIKMKSLLLN